MRWYRNTQVTNNTRVNKLTNKKDHKIKKQKQVSSTKMTEILYNILP